MRYIEVPGVGKPCSQLTLGTMVFTPERRDEAFALLDAFAERGGTVIDTAHIYAGGSSERIIGEWLRLRGTREQMVVMTKGAHPDHTGPRVRPECIAQDLGESLERLQTDYIDLYLLHRDDPQVPVAEIMDALHEHQESGRIRAIGVSNWKFQRIDEANAYARRRGWPGIVANSPHLSLAKPNEPRWPGCVAADAPYVEWHKRTQMPMFPWSAQASGFFTGRYTPDNRQNPDIVRVYYSEDNWKRLQRASEFGARLGVSANQVALAYVLCQPFPVSALIGPERVSELLDSWPALDVALSEADLSWLEVHP